MFLRRGFSRSVLISLGAMLVALSTSVAQAKLFTNSYVSFELPDSWDCKLDGTEYVCASRFAKEAKEAIIILTAKEAGPTDSTQQYKAYLETPKSVPDKTGKMVPSKKLNAEQVMLNSHPWIDSLHIGSEINSYYTRYLATVKDGLGILVTFSAHKDHYTKYSQDFINAVKSLRVLAVREAPAVDRPDIRTVGPGETIGPGTIQPMTDPIQLPTEGEGTGIMEKVLALLLLLAAVGYYLWKKKKG